MADGLCTGAPDHRGPKSAKKDIGVTGETKQEKLLVQFGDDSYKTSSDGDCVSNNNQLVISDVQGGTLKKDGFSKGPLEDDCRKKRCVDRYDSSESSDSGVAILSCTDCSGSSNSSDITDPGSPFSTASSHSDDSAGGAPHKMPPTQTAHHPPWPWNTNPTIEENPSKRTKVSKENNLLIFPKRLKQEERKKSAVSLKDKKIITLKSVPVNGGFVVGDVAPSPIEKLVNHNNNVQKCSDSSSNKRTDANTAKLQHQGKITEYFKSQIKSNVILKKELSTLAKPTSKLISLVDTQKKFNHSFKAQNARKTIMPSKKADNNRRKSTVTVPRKILPAPSKVPEPQNLSVNNQVQNLTSFANTVTLVSPVSFPPNLAYIHTKAPKPPDNIYVPQFITNPTINMLQPMQKLTTLNNFNIGVKLNATMVPIVKLNTAIPSTPSRLPMATSMGSLPGSVPFSVETALPTVLSAKPKTQNDLPQVNSIIKIANVTANQQGVPLVNVNRSCRNDQKEQPYRTEECQTQVIQNKCSQTQTEILRTDKEEKPPTPDSDSGISASPKECLQICVSEEVHEEEPKSPILSQPKTIRFPCKRDLKVESVPKYTPEGHCKWTECSAKFNGGGALLEHLQLKHVISQMDQEHYVCLWMGCKVHGRTSCSRSWLERHVLAHAGNKPYRCIVDGCGQRFSSQVMLERHVNSHFNSDGTQNGNPRKSAENGPTKMFKRNGKKIRFRRQPWSARMFDFIDSGIMEGVQYKLMKMTQARTLGTISHPGDSINLHSEILARRTESDGIKKVLVRWHPADVVSDEWVNEKEFTPTKMVSIPLLDSAAKEALKPTLFPPNSSKNNVNLGNIRKKHRRKPSNNIS